MTDGLSPEEFLRRAHEAGHDSLGLAHDISPENYSWEQLVSGLEKVFEKYPSVYNHFFFAELDPEAYDSLFIKSRPVLELVDDDDEE